MLPLPAALTKMLQPPWNIKTSHHECCRLRMRKVIKGSSLRPAFHGIVYIVAK